MPRNDRKAPRTLGLELLAPLASWAVIVVCSLSLLGFALDLRFLRFESPNPINPTVAIFAISASLALLVLRPGSRQRSLGLLLASAVAASGFFGILGFFFGWHLNLGTVLFPQVMKEYPDFFSLFYSAAAATFMALIGLAILIGERPHESRLCPGQLLALAALLIPMLAITGHAYSSRSLLQLSFYNPMPLSVAFLLFLLALGVLFRHPDHDPAALFGRDTHGAVLARWLVPLFLLIPLGLGWLRLRGEMLGLYDTMIGTALVASFMSALTVGLVWGSTLLIDRVEKEGQKARAQLHESLERFRSAFDNASIGMGLVSPEGQWIKINPALCRISGYSVEELLRRTTLEITHPDDRAQSQALYQELFRNEIENFELEKRYLRKDGSTRWVLVKTSLVRDLEGHPLYAISQVQDIDENKKAREALRLSEARFSKAFYASPIMMGLNDPETGAYLDINDRYIQTIGYQREEALGKDSAQLKIVTPEVRDLFHQLMRQQGHVQNLEIAFFTRSGERRYGLLFGEFIETGQQRFILGMVNDVTELRRAQQAQFEALRQADQVKDEFLSVISHELRTPLNSIMGFGSLLDDEVAGPLNPRQHDFLDKLLRSSDRMLALVDDLLDFARIQAGKFSILPAPTDVPGLIEEAIASFGPAADAKGVRIEREVDVPSPIRLDRNRIFQVLANLLSNSLKFVPDGGWIRVRAFLEGPWLVTEIQDNGSGIAPEDLPKLFHPFKQLEMGLTRKVGGVGLGLSISKAIVEAHGGTIEAKSVPGQGSTFRFKLPIEKAP
ncbi:MAG: PAS domain S-box protein [Bacteroidota bacterium]